MPICSFPDCSEFAVQGNVRCSKHQIRNKTDEKNESQHFRKLKIAKEEADRRTKEQEDRQSRADAKTEADQRLREFQADVIRTHRQRWNAQIDSVVSQVLVLRVTNPDANAGNNSNGNTLGGSNSEIDLTTTGAMHGVTRADIFRGMAGFDGSDSTGHFKFRRSNVLVHCK